MENRLDLALNEARRVLAINPRHAKAHNLMGACLASLGQRDQARAAFQASLAADPRDPATYTNLATLELQAGNRDRATRYFAEALTIDPDVAAARQGLARIARTASRGRSSPRTLGRTQSRNRGLTHLPDHDRGRHRAAQSKVTKSDPKRPRVTSVDCSLREQRDVT